MEDTLRDPIKFNNITNCSVLILVLMEDTLRDKKKVRVEDPKTVLILVLMEDTLRVLFMILNTLAFSGLNPCFNGRYSQRARHTNPLYKLDWYL